MAEAATDVGRGADLPEQPRQTLGATRRFAQRELAELLRGYSGIAPDSNTRVGGAVERSISAGILEFGLTATKPEPNCSPG